jgi:hypothetical protein
MSRYLTELSLRGIIIYSPPGGVLLGTELKSQTFFTVQEADVLVHVIPYMRYTISGLLS